MDGREAKCYKADGEGSDQLEGAVSLGNNEESKNESQSCQFSLEPLSVEDPAEVCCHCTSGMLHLIWHLNLCCSCILGSYLHDQEGKKERCCPHGMLCLLTMASNWRGKSEVT